MMTTSWKQCMVVRVPNLSQLANRTTCLHSYCLVIDRNRRLTQIRRTITALQIMRRGKRRFTTSRQVLSNISALNWRRQILETSVTFHQLDSSSSSSSSSFIILFPCYAQVGRFPQSRLWNKLFFARVRNTNCRTCLIIVSQPPLASFLLTSRFFWLLGWTEA